MSVKNIKHLGLSIVLVLTLGCSHNVKAQWMMSFSGTYNMPTRELKDNFQSQIGYNTSLHYKIPNKPFEASLSISFTAFRAKEEIEDFYKMMQQDTLGFKYEIHKYSAPVVLGFRYYPLYKKKIQTYVGLGFGAHYLVDKTKMIGKYTSTTIKEDTWETMLNAGGGIIYRIKDDLGIQLSFAYLSTLKNKPMAYGKLSLGIIYHI